MRNWRDLASVERELSRRRSSPAGRSDGCRRDGRDDSGSTTVSGVVPERYSPLLGVASACDSNSAGESVKSPFQYRVVPRSRTASTASPRTRSDQPGFFSGAASNALVSPPNATHFRATLPGLVVGTSALTNWKPPILEKVAPGCSAGAGFWIAQRSGKSRRWAWRRSLHHRA